MKLISIIRLLLGFKPVKRAYRKRKAEFWANPSLARKEIKAKRLEAERQARLLKRMQTGQDKPQNELPIEMKF